MGELQAKCVKLVSIHRGYVGYVQQPLATDLDLY